MAGYQDFTRDLNAALAIAFQDAEDSFELDRHGMVTIAFDGLGEVVLQAMPENETALLSATVCPVAAEDTALMRRALEANLFRIAPAGAFIAYDPDTSVLSLCQSTGARVRSPDGLTDSLSAFVGGIGAVRSLLLSPSVHTDGRAQFSGDVSDVIISG